MVRGRAGGTTPEQAKRKADAYFLRKYAGLTYRRIANVLGVSTTRATQLSNPQRSVWNSSGQYEVRDPFAFTVCHPNKSCL